MRGARFPHEVLAVVLQVRQGSLHVLLWQRAEPPFEGRWALPGGPLGEDERLGTSLGQHLAAKVDLTDIAHMEQLETRSDPARDPRGRVLATAYLALISAGAEPRVPPDTAWHPVQDLPPTAFDHGSITRSGRERLRAKLSYTNIGFALAPETFTIAQLRDIYAASVGHAISATNLQRILTRRGVIEATPAAARPAPLAAGPPPSTGSRPGRWSSPIPSPRSARHPCHQWPTGKRALPRRVLCTSCGWHVHNALKAVRRNRNAGDSGIGISVTATLLAARTLPTACVLNGFGKCPGATPK